MTSSRALPSDFTLRPACSTDKAAIHNLLTQFRQEVLPPVSPSDRLLRFGAIAILVGLFCYLVTSLGWQAFVNQLLGVGIAIGLGMAVATFIAWNEDWKNFWLIEHHHQPIACAKLRRSPTHSLLHDVYVKPEWRSQGIGSYMVSHLSDQATKPLYLTCVPSRVQFYMRIGFIPTTTKALSPLVRYELGLSGRPEVIPLVLK